MTNLCNVCKRRPGTGSPATAVCDTCRARLGIAGKPAIEWNCPQCGAPNGAINVSLAELAIVLPSVRCLKCGRPGNIADLGGRAN